MNLLRAYCIVLGAVLLSTSQPSQAQVISGIGTDPLTGDFYQCAAYNPRSKNRIIITSTKSKKKTYKINDAKQKVSDRITDAKLRLRTVKKSLRQTQKQLKTILESFNAPLFVAKIVKLQEQEKKLNDKITSLQSDLALLQQLKSLIENCKQQDPINASLQVHSGIFPPGVPGAGYYYVFIIYVFFPNVSTDYCGYIEQTPNFIPTRIVISPKSNVCTSYNIPECFNPTNREAGFLVRNWIGPNRPQSCRNPGDVCDLTSALAAANEYMGKLKIYDVKAIDNPRECK